MSIISSNRTDITFNTHKGKTQCIEVTLKKIDNVTRLSLHRVVYILYSIRKAKSIGKNNDKIYCPYFAVNNFILGFRNSADNPIELLEACSSCIYIYDSLLSTHVSNIAHKIYLLRKKFGYDVAGIIINYGWGI